MAEFCSADPRFLLSMCVPLADIDAMRNTARVSAFWPGAVLRVRRAIDVVLSWTSFDSTVVTVQCVAVHVLPSSCSSAGPLAPARPC